jgi:hypothetical protein
MRENLSILINDKDYNVTIRRHTQAKRLTLHIDPARQIRLTVPRRCSERHMQTFLHSQTSWLQKQLLKVSSPLALKPGAYFPLRGEQHLIAHDPKIRTLALIENGTVFIGGDIEHFSRRLCEFLKKEARKDLYAACIRYCAALEVSIKRMQLRDQRTRWGSCNNKGVVCFSWRLIFAPPYVLDYLAAHELAHLRIMNHSKRFWGLVNQICLHTKQARHWLKENGNILHAIEV